MLATIYEDATFITPQASPTPLSVTNPPLPPFSCLPSSSTLTSLPSTSSLADRTLIELPQFPKTLSPDPETPPPPQRLYSSLSDSSNYLSSPFTSQKMSNVSSTDAARVQTHGSGRAPPVLTKGHLRNPETLAQFEDVGHVYVRRQEQKGVTLTHIISNLIDGLVENLPAAMWFKQNEAALVKLNFTAFMSAFRERFLPTTWRTDLANEILQEAMAEGVIFIDWLKNLRARNGLLANYPEFVSDVALLANLHGRISPPLQNMIRNIPDIHNCTNLDKWVKLVTEGVEYAREAMAAMIANGTMQAPKCPHNDPVVTTATTSIGATNPSDSTLQVPRQPRCINSAPPNSSTFTYKYQGRLCDDERTVLAANGGCFACHDIDIPRKEQGYSKCKGRPPPTAGYEARTAEWVIKRRADKAKGLPLFTIAVVSSTPAQPTPVPPPVPVITVTPAAPVAAIKVLGTTAWPIAATISSNESSILEAHNKDGTVADADLSNDSDAVSAKRTPVPFAIPHIMWNFALESRDPSVITRTNVTGLVDDGAHLVLIRPQLLKNSSINVACCLNLLILVLPSQILPLLLLV
ncbi:hypothetical protein EDD18DRAFT_1113399 [Armillaria luteobubalina]|uniref:Uncharacterized protein n=1 Tax=Armillaria luteobubalina TaxID=153913 RepID=A0AA39UBY8_9AGAR|nr:hypothetical protein EDD18DRAFT_1113399 [Armillaria luteobubalina]